MIGKKRTIEEFIERGVAAQKAVDAEIAAAAPAPAKFSAADQDIKQGQMTVARAVSKTFAKRIANALNRYTPDRRGQ